MRRPSQHQRRSRKQTPIRPPVRRVAGPSRARNAGRRPQNTGGRPRRTQGVITQPHRRDSLRGGERVFDTNQPSARIASAARPEHTCCSGRPSIRHVRILCPVGGGRRARSMAYPLPMLPKLTSRPGTSNRRPVARRQRDVPHPGAGEGVESLGFAWHAPRRAKKTPCLDQRPAETSKAPPVAAVIPRSVLATRIAGHRTGPARPPRAH